MEAIKRMPERPRPEFRDAPRVGPSDRIISFLRHNTIVVFLYEWLTDTVVPLVLAVLIVVPVGAVLLLFYLPKFYRNWRRRRRYGVRTTDVKRDK
jgi:hypothetical protein